MSMEKISSDDSADSGSGNGGGDSEGQLSRKALELEKINSMTENVTDPEMKNAMIFKMDVLNETLRALEKQSGLSEAEIIDSYNELAEKIKDGSLSSLVEEFEPDVQALVLSDIARQKFDSFIAAVKQFSPDRLAYATSVILMLTLLSGVAMTGPMANVASAEEFGNGDMSMLGGQGTVERVSLQEKYTKMEASLTAEINKLVNDNKIATIKNAQLRNSNAQMRIAIEENNSRLLTMQGAFTKLVAELELERGKLQDTGISLSDIERQRLEAINTAIEKIKENIKADATIYTLEEAVKTLMQSTSDLAKIPQGIKL